MQILEQISMELQKGDAGNIALLTQKAIDQKLNPEIILDDGLIAGMNIVGKKFKAHEIFLPNVLLAAKAMQAGMDLLKPLLINGDTVCRGRIVTGTVQGDLHDIGRNLVGIMLKGAGFEVIDLGNDVRPSRFVEAAVEENASVIGMSALLTTTMPVMKKVIDILKQQDLYGKIRVIVGGAPVSSRYAEEIGADAACFDGASAVESVKELLGVN